MLKKYRIANALNRQDLIIKCQTFEGTSIWNPKMHEVNGVRLQLFCIVQSLSPKDTVAFLLKHLNLLLFSTKVRAVTFTTDEKFYTFKVSSEEITHYADPILITAYK